MLVLWASLAWLAILALAIANAALREGFFARHVSALRAHQLSSLTLSVTVFVVAGALQVLVAADAGSMLLVGAAWTAATVAFEFLAGHYLFKNSWSSLLADYNLLRGRLWLLVLLSTLFAPPLVAL